MSTKTNVGRGVVLTKTEIEDIELLMFLAFQSLRFLIYNG